MTSTRRDEIALEQRITEFVEDRFVETAQLVSVSDITRQFGASARRAANRLVDKKALAVLYEGSGLPRLVAPRHMFDEAIRQQTRPRWVDAHKLPGQEDASREFHEQARRAHRFRLLEMLLFATGVPLEHAVGEALRVLGFSDVVMTENPTDCDVRFRDGSLRFLSEAKGKSGQLEKDDVLQLVGWVNQDIANGGEPATVRGVLVVNNHRHVPPDQRGIALTDEAKRFARLHRYGVWTSTDLHARCAEVLAADNEESAARRHQMELLSMPHLPGAQDGNG